MTDTRPIEITPPDLDAPLDKPTLRDVQRTALADLLQLSKECSAHEAELEAKHQQSQADSRVKLDKSVLSAEHRLETLHKQTEAAAEDAARRLEVEYQHELRKIRDNAAHRRTVANAAYDASKSDVKKKFDHATWLADSVLEAAEVSATQTYRTEIEKQNEQAEQLAAIEADAAHLVQKYGQEPVPVKLLPAITTPVDKPQYDEARLTADKQIQALHHLSIARLFTGITPLLIGLLILIGVGVGVQYHLGTAELNVKQLSYAVGGAFVGLIIIGVALKVLINTKIKKTYGPLRDAVAQSCAMLDALANQAKARRAEEVRLATAARNADVDATRQRFAPVQAKATQVREAAINNAEAEQQSMTAELERRVKEKRDELARRKAAQLEDATKKSAAERSRLSERFSSDSTEVDARYRERRADLQRRWREGIADIQAPIGQDESPVGSSRDWRAFERAWKPPTAFPATIAFGSLAIDLKRISAGIPRDADGELALPDQFSVPALLAFPSQASLLIETDPEGREQALGVLQMAMTRLLTQ
ncbi:MAG: segregation ATPase, FtsK/SpoIIIE family, partial [Phycisphaerales bacterium]|nr:segregation ATPase, FtsK/SpoIIIE family [Phycisphaerales bacterium]